MSRPLRVVSPWIARIPTLSYCFKPNSSSLAPTMAFRARLLTSGPLCGFEPNGSSLAPSVLFYVGSLISPRPSCHFKPDCSSLSLRARVLVSHPDRAFSSPNARLPPPDCVYYNLLFDYFIGAVATLYRNDLARKSTQPFPCACGVDWCDCFDISLEAN